MIAHKTPAAELSEAFNIILGHVLEHDALDDLAVHLGADHWDSLQDHYSDPFDSAALH